MPTNTKAVTSRIILLLATVSAALAQTPSSKGVNFYSIEKEIELGKQLAAETQTSLQAQPDARLQAIGDKLAAKTDDTFQYRFYIYASLNPQPEPIALPGGPVFVAQNMLSAADSETAAILAHAIAHIALRHYTRELTRRDMMEVGAKAAANTAGATGGAQLASRTYRAQWNTNFEFDADRLAVKLMIDAGYDPQGLVRWLESFPVPKINLALGDIPAPSGRIQAVQQAINAAR
jgi:beta-barrel assembly-enhancing protease